MGADTITVKPEAVARARRSILMQLEATSNLVETFGSMSAALEALNMWDFINNEAECTACDREWAMHERRVGKAMVERVRSEQ